MVDSPCHYYTKQFNLWATHLGFRRKKDNHPKGEVDFISFMCYTD